MKLRVTGSIDPNSARIEVVDGVPVPSVMSAKAISEDPPFEVDVVIELREGRMVATSVTCSTGEAGNVSTEILRQIPVAQIVTSGVLSAVGMLPLAGTDLAALRRAGPTHETLGAVAAVYRLAYLTSGRPTAYVRETFGVSKSTASRWVQLARAKGFLGAASPRRAGEHQGGKS
jgi:hypothetical protein